MLDHELTVAESSTIFGAQAAKLRGPKLVVRQASTVALADRHERQSVGGDDLY